MKKGNDIKKSFSNRKFKMGGFQTLTMVIVIVVVVVLNMIVGKMNLTVDLSSDKIFTLTEDTKKLAEGLSDDITLYYMCQDGKEAVQIEKVIDQYDKLGHISVERKDPVIYPNFAKTYTEDEITDNDVIVVNEKKNKSKHIKSSDMVIQDVDYSTYSQTNTLDAEGQLTAAIQSVTSTETKKVYITSGHGEQELDGSFTDILHKSNMETASLDTASQKKVPDDCNILLINGAQYDITEAEYNVLSAYMKNGGKAMFFMNVEASKQPYLTKLLSDYGINTVAGYVFDSEKCVSDELPTYLVPEVESHDITKEATNVSVCAPLTIGMTSQSKVRSTLKVEPLLKTSESAFSRTDKKASSMNKIDGDTAGPFSVAMAATDEYPEKRIGPGHAAKLVVYGSYSFAGSGFIADNKYGNRSMILNSLTWLTGSETSTLAIPKRSLDEQSVKIQEGDQVFWIAALVIVLPLVLLIIGFIIWYRRRKG